jgi:NTP pyrophosphatase (non-canonical NTP hydrolase)
MQSDNKDSLRELTRSTAEFYARFGVTPVLQDAVPIFEEEVRELIEAARTGTDKDHIAEEAGDVFVTAIGICLASGIEVDQLLAQVYAVVAKNDAKTHETHHYVEGKIRRRYPKGTGVK